MELKLGFFLLPLIFFFQVQLRKRLRAHEEKDAPVSVSAAEQEGALPAYLIDRKDKVAGKALSQQVSCLGDKPNQRKGLSPPLF